MAAPACARRTTPWWPPARAARPSAFCIRCSRTTIARARQAGEGGIKALVIYPMNALAADQALGRIAAMVASVPAFAGLRVGLYVGGNTGNAGEGMMMTPRSVITDQGHAAQAPARHPADQL